MQMASLRSVLTALLALTLSACAAWPDRPAVSASDQADARIAGYDDIRIWGDAPRKAWIDWREQLFAERKRTGRSTRLEMLAISSGSDKGAYSAGYLNGWSEAGSRPEFDIVSGVSTGALIAPFAFLGTAYDPHLTSLYTTINADAIYNATPLKGVFGGAALASTKPLAELIESYANADLIDAVGREHRRGRRLLVQTTNLDAQRGVVWDMGAIAASENPARYNLFRRVLLASASIPGLFPPVLIEVTSADTDFSELHVDGATVSSLVAIPPAFVFDTSGTDAYVQGRVTILYNGALEPVFRVSEPTVFSLLDRALDTALKAADQRTIQALRRHADEAGLTLDVHSIGPLAEDPDVDLFDPDFMQMLYDRGHKAGLSAHRAIHGAD